MCMEFNLNFQFMLHQIPSYMTTYIMIAFIVMYVSLVTTHDYMTTESNQTCCFYHL
jgi:hypothetical protein